MTLVDRYLAGRTASALFRTLLTILVLFIFIDMATRRRGDILEHSIPVSIVAEFYAMQVPTILRDYQVAAVAMLASYLLVLGRAAQNRETTALLASGISVYRFIRMPVLVGVVFALGVFGLSETIGVPAAARASLIKKTYFESTPGYKIAPISWANLDGGWTCHIYSFDRNTMSGEGVLMLNLGPAMDEQIEAEQIRWDERGDRWMLEGGMWSIFYPEERMEVESRRITLEASPIVESPKELFVSDVDSGSKTLPELRREIQVASHRHVPTRRTEVDYHSRLAKPVLSFVMMWLAVPFALQLGRAGIAASLVGGVGMGLIYLIADASALGLGDLGRLAPWLAAWLATFVFGAVAAVLMSRTTT